MAGFYSSHFGPQGLFHERTFNHVVTLVAMARFLEAHVVQDAAGVFQHRRTAAQHEAVVGLRRCREAKVAEQLAAEFGGFVQEG